MKITIDTAQSPQALLNEFTQAIRVALGPRFYVEEGEQSNEPAFTATELADPNVNLVPLNSAAVVQTAPPAASAGATQGAAETDSAGNIWDMRIHSGGKSKIANGTWKLAKGMSDKKDYVEQINAQNRALMATPLPTTAPSNVVALPSLAPVVAALPDLPTLPPVAQVAAPDVEIVVTDYPTFAQFVAQQMMVKPTVTKNQCDIGLTHYGIVTNGAPDLAALQHRPDVVMPLYTWLKAVIDLTAEPA